MKTIYLYFIHGFLQDSSVWSEIGDKILSNSSNVKKHYVDLLNSISPSAEKWSKNFNKSIEHSANNLNVIIGYSLGGRLAMQSIADDPYLWDAGILIGAHPGFKTVQDKNDSLSFDLKWAEKFKQESFNTLLKEWNSLPIFGKKPNSFMPDQKYKNIYSEICKNYSKGLQADLTEKITKSGVPILYISGSNDLKYKTIGNYLANTSKNIKHVVIENSFHRVPWENKNLFIKTVNYFLQNLIF